MKAQTKIQSQIKALADEIIEINEYGDGVGIVFVKNNVNFCAMIDPGMITVYRVYRSGGQWEFLPNSKKGKAFKVIENFVKSRI